MFLFLLVLGRMCLAGLKEDTILDILGLSHQYGFQELECAISNVLKQMLALKNVCSILDMAQLFGLKQLVNVCLDFIDKHSIDVLNHKSFLLLSQVNIGIIPSLRFIVVGCPCRRPWWKYCREIRSLRLKSKCLKGLVIGVNTIRISMIWS